MIATFQHLESGSLRLSEPYALSENASLNTSPLFGTNVTGPNLGRFFSRIVVYIAGTDQRAIGMMTASTEFIDEFGCCCHSVRIS